MRYLVRLPGLIIAILALAAVAFAASQLTVQVSQSRIRKDAKFWAPSVAAVSAGDQLSEMSRKGDWIKVKNAAGASGWIHSSAVTSKKITLGSGSKTAGRDVSADEISLAGKGFTEEVEKEYSKANRDLDFSAVDRMVSLTLSDSDLESFLKEGKLAEWGVGR